MTIKQTTSALPLIAIVIPFPRMDGWVIECVSGCAQIDYPSFEIWLLPDEAFSADQLDAALRAAKNIAVRVLPTGRATNPAQKRNVALHASCHEWLALIDADAFPRQDWLRNAVCEIADDVGVVAGPNITPPQDPFLRQVSGLVMRSPLGFGGGYIRHHPVSRRDVMEMPTCNMLIRRLPGLFFREEFDTGEDMIYCRDTRERGLRVVYAPDVVVFHHRRSFPFGFSRQFFWYGCDKGRLFARNHGASRLAHAAPAGLLLYAVSAFLLALHWHLPLWCWLPAIVYVFLVAIESMRCARNPLLALSGLIAFPVAHASYGLGFFYGIPKGVRERA